MLDRIANFYPLLLKAFEYDDNENKDKYIDVTSLAELYAFVSLVAGKRADTGVKYFYELARDFCGDFESLFKSIITIFEENQWRIRTLFNENVSNIDYYDRVSKYVLFKYENKLRATSGYPLMPKEAFFETDPRYTLSKEHITARKASNLKYSSEFEEKYLHNIGNLVIDTKASNSAKGSKNVDDKLISYKLAPMISHNEIDDMVNEIKKEKGRFSWNEIEDVQYFIEYRRNKIENFIKDEWSYDSRAINCSCSQDLI